MGVNFRDFLGCPMRIIEPTALEALNEVLPPFGGIDFEKLANVALLATSHVKEKGPNGGYKEPELFDKLLIAAAVLVGDQDYSHDGIFIYQKIAEELKDERNPLPTGAGELNPSELVAKRVKAVQAVQVGFSDSTLNDTDKFACSIWLIDFYNDLNEEQKEKLGFCIYCNAPKKVIPKVLELLGNVIVEKKCDPSFSAELATSYMTIAASQLKGAVFQCVEDVTDRLDVGDPGADYLLSKLDGMLTERFDRSPMKIYMGQSLKARKGSALSAHSTEEFMKWWKTSTQEQQNQVCKTVFTRVDGQHPLYQALAVERASSPVRPLNSPFSIIKSLLRGLKY